ncbi:MAG: phosphotransferase [Alphaproteobacteria bacterium]|nr:phosphotransferase [Alphaproteobacteria bacterium]
MDDRSRQIEAFLDRNGWRGAARTLLAADASFRSYDRLRHGTCRAVLMNAPPPRENIRPFVKISKLLHRLELSAPTIYAKDEVMGLILLEDFGDQTYTKILNESPEREVELYNLAVDVLVELHRRFSKQIYPCAPCYDDEVLLDEAALLFDWYLPEMGLGVTGASERSEYLDLWRAAAPLARHAPDTLVLRDYHVDNLMVLDGKDGVSACGLLDFQDAVIGPATYDLVSLLEDARRDVPGPMARDLRNRYLSAFPEFDKDAFDASYAMLGAQRSAKIIGIFTRLAKRDGKSGYLQHISRTWRCLEGALQHPALADIRDWFDRVIPSEQRRAPLIGNVE